MPRSKSPKRNIVLTFGYGNRKDYSSFLGYFEEFDVHCVIDVRLSPRAWSRKWYGDAIEKLCISKSVQYKSEPTLGNTSGSSRWIPPVQEEADRTLHEVARMLEDGNVLLLCSEMDYSRCHRVEVAQRLQSLTSAPIKHLS
jgi:uncharacterized protein (DUF488 family)